MAKKIINFYKNFSGEFNPEIGKKYFMDKNENADEKNFHIVDNPFELIGSFDVTLDHKYYVVEKNDNEDNDETAPFISMVEEEIGLEELLKRGIERLKHETIVNEDTTNMASLNDNGTPKINIVSNGFFENINSNGYKANIASNGKYAKIVSSGHNAKIDSNGKFAKIVSSGHNAKIYSNGYFSRINQNGNYAQVASSGMYAKIASSSTLEKIISSGERSQIASNGSATTIGSTGDNVKLVTNGTDAQIASSGNVAKIASNGNFVKIVSTGNKSKIASNGDYAKVDSKGKKSIIGCFGEDSVAKAKKGSWITLSEWKYSEDEKENVPICVKAEYVDGTRIKEDTWYKLENGEFIEVNL